MPSNLIGSSFNEQELTLLVTIFKKLLQGGDLEVIARDPTLEKIAEKSARLLQRFEERKK